MRFTHRLWLALAAGASTSAALADGPRTMPTAQMLPAYRQECAACHIAYPPSLLPRASWQRLMADLPHHFGTDASLEPALVQQIGSWLNAHAGDTARGRAVAAPPDDRITRAPWFVREHREVPAATWQRASIKSAANCTACHTRADQGDFDEHAVRIPR